LEAAGARELERHCGGCARCRGLAARHGVLAGWIKAGQAAPGPGPEAPEANERLSMERAALLARLPELTPRSPQRTLSGMAPGLAPGLALGAAPAALAVTAVLLCGFAGGWAVRARMAPGTAPAELAGRLGPAPIHLQIEDIQGALALNEVAIRYAAVRQEQLAAPLGDARVQQLLLQAIEQPTNAGMRIDAIHLLSQAGLQTHNPAAVQAAFLAALGNDPNPGVRLRAVMALAPMAAANQSGVLVALAQAAAADGNGGVRAQAVQDLAQSAAAAPLLRRLGSETRDPGLRLGCAAALQKLQAGVPAQWLAAGLGGN
ncbi:MAG: hypothetical protein ACRD1L_03255, partial [Terriglobales bacterium]